MPNYHLKHLSLGWPTVLCSQDMSSFHITIFYPYRGGITYFKCIEINKVSLSKLRVSFELAHVFAGPSVLIFGNQNMVTLLKFLSYSIKKASLYDYIVFGLINEAFVQVLLKKEMASSSDIELWNLNIESYF